MGYVVMMLLVMRKGLGRNGSETEWSQLEKRKR